MAQQSELNDLAKQKAQAQRDAQAQREAQINHAREYEAENAKTRQKIDSCENFKSAKSDENQSSFPKALLSPPKWRNLCPICLKFQLKTWSMKNGKRGTGYWRGDQ